MKNPSLSVHNRCPVQIVPALQLLRGNRVKKTRRPGPSTMAPRTTRRNPWLKGRIEPRSRTREFRAPSRRYFFSRRAVWSFEPPTPRTAAGKRPSSAKKTLLESPACSNVPVKRPDPAAQLYGEIAKQNRQKALDPCSLPSGRPTQSNPGPSIKSVPLPTPA